ncbi:MAG TPA: hypothetical protein VKU82_05945 [Planctomycetaceae bacterium]|nr:hypothetical protein [Planctomycetaceae bacterium]
MRESCFELSVGESVEFEDQILTVIDISGDEITFRVDFADEVESHNVRCGERVRKQLPPR